MTDASAPAPAAPARTQATRLRIPSTRSTSQLRPVSTSAVPPARPATGLQRKPSIPLRGAAAAGIASDAGRNGPATTRLASTATAKQDDPFRAPPPPPPATAGGTLARAKSQLLPRRPKLDMSAKPPITSSRPPTNTTTTTITAAAPAPLGVKKTVPALPPSGQAGVRARATSSQIIRKPSVSRFAPAPAAISDKPAVSMRPTAPAAPAPVFASPPAPRPLKRVVSRGFGMTTRAITSTPGNTTFTPSPTKRPHSFHPLATQAETQAETETPLLPRLRGMVSIDQMPMIADASISFEDSPKKASGRQAEREAEKEAEVKSLRTALRASEAALARIKEERDEAKRAEERLELAARDQKWEVVIRAIQDELERNREYRDVLARYQHIITAMKGTAVAGTQQ